jgi:hypothetical protein
MEKEGRTRGKERGEEEKRGEDSDEKLSIPFKLEKQLCVIRRSG